MAAAVGAAVGVDVAGVRVDDELFDVAHDADAVLVATLFDVVVAADGVFEAVTAVEAVVPPAAMRPKMPTALAPPTATPAVTRRRRRSDLSRSAAVVGRRVFIRRVSVGAD